MTGGEQALKHALAAVLQRTGYAGLLREVDGGLDPNWQGHNSMTALMVAAKEGDMEVVRLLCRAPSVDVNKRNNLGWTALMFAADRGHESVVRELVALDKTDLNVASKIDGATALITATSRGHAGVVQVLCTRADLELNKHNSIGWTALMFASFENDGRIVDHLLARHDVDLARENKAGVSAVTMAAMRGNLDVVWKLVARGGSVEPSWFESTKAAAACEDLTARAAARASACRAVLHDTHWAASGVPRHVAARVLALAFGNELVALGPQRAARLEASERLVSALGPR